MRTFVFLSLPMTVPVLSQLVPVFSLVSLFCPCFPCFVPDCTCFVPACPYCPCFIPAVPVLSLLVPVLSLIVPVLSLLVPVLSLVNRGITGLLPKILSKLDNLSYIWEAFIKKEKYFINIWWIRVLHPPTSAGVYNNKKKYLILSTSPDQPLQTLNHILTFFNIQRIGPSGLILSSRPDVHMYVCMYVYVFVCMLSPPNGGGGG